LVGLVFPQTLPELGLLTLAVVAVLPTVMMLEPQVVWGAVELAQIEMRRRPQVRQIPAGVVAVVVRLEHGRQLGNQVAPVS
jgi:hypothetical protein